MNNIAQKTSKLYNILTLSLFVLAFILLQPDGASAQVSGSGTIGRIPKWGPTSTTQLENSGITELPSGNIGIGTINPLTLLHMKTGDIYNKFIIDAGTNSPQIAEIAFFDRGVHIWELVKTHSNDFGIYDSAVGYRVYVLKTNGNVGIGTNSPSTKLHVVGDITVTGNINAKYQDVAEWVPARTALSAGTVVVLDPEQSNQVMASALPYDTRVAGVISQQPGLILGEGGEGKVMVATTGRVRMKVDATHAPIRVGDLLVTSAQEGIAMRSEPLDLAGTKIHRPGTIIGKALEPLAKGKGEILVLLSMQ